MRIFGEPFGGTRDLWNVKQGGTCGLGLDFVDIQLVPPQYRYHILKHNFYANMIYSTTT